MTRQPFDDLTDVYEALVDWPKRLQREEPFYRHLFAEGTVQHIADVACGTGHHAAMFHQWKLQVEGSDASPAMIDRARQRFGEPDGLRWLVRSFDAPTETTSSFDAVICVGNSLALASDHDCAQRAVREMLRAVRSGGVVVLHLLNLWKLPDGPCVWQKCLEFERGDVAGIVTKGVHRSASRGYVDLIVTSITPPGILTAESIPLLGLTSGQIRDWARSAGATNIQFFGDYQRTPYQQESSTDLIAIITR